MTSGLGRDSVVGAATGYGLDGAGVDSRRGHGCLCCVCCTVKDKRQSQDNQDKEVRTKYRARTKKKSRWVRDFPRAPRAAQGPPILLYDGYRLYFPEIKRSGRGVNHPPPSAEVKERVELYLYSSGRPRVVLG